MKVPPRLSLNWRTDWFFITINCQLCSMAKLILSWSCKDSFLVFMIEMLLICRVISGCLTPWKWKTFRKVSYILEERTQCHWQNWYLTRPWNSFIFIDLWWEILIGPLCFFEYRAYQWIGKENVLVGEELSNALIVFQWTGFGFF